MSERFHVSELLGQASVEIEGPEARHIARVMRMKIGDSVTLFDGLDNEATASIVEISKNSVRLEIAKIDQVSREASVSVTVATALPKGDRLKFMVEKLTEIGVARLIPIVFDRSSVRPKDNTIEKMRRYVVEASKQCERNRLMDIAPSIQAKELFSSFNGTGIVCRPAVELTLASAIGSAAGPITLCVGPEGGITNDELQSALDNAWLAASFGPRVLRTETAAIFASSVAIAR